MKTELLKLSQHLPLVFLKPRYGDSKFVVPFEKRLISLVTVESLISIHAKEKKAAKSSSSRGRFKI